MKQKSRAYEAGFALGKTVVEMVNLMYQKNTQKNFWRGLYGCLHYHFDDATGNKKKRPVHFWNKPEVYDTGGHWLLTCAPIDCSKNEHTRNVKKVTCKNCLRIINAGVRK